MPSKTRKRKTKPRYAPGSRAGKGGRRPRDPSGTGTPIYLRPSAAEYATIATAAIAAGAKVADFARSAAVDAARKLLKSHGITEIVSPVALSS
jgi:hypothetical protein